MILRSRPSPAFARADKLASWAPEEGDGPWKYWIDTEFIEHPFTIDLISIGIVAEDGREFYAESSEVDWSKASSWTLQTVKPQLGGKVMEREQIGYAIRNFTRRPVRASRSFCGLFPGLLPVDRVQLSNVRDRQARAALPLSAALPGHQTVGHRAGGR